MDELDLAQASRRYWEFHWGLSPRRNVPMRGPRSLPAVTWQLATLEGLELSNGSWVRPGRSRIHLASDRYGRNLYLVARYGVVLERGTPLGRIAAVEYRTHKLGEAARLWRHDFEGRRPVLASDRDARPVIRRAGSQFRITWRGIVG